MEGTQPAARAAAAAGRDGNQEVDQKLLMTSKPLHRFMRMEPKSLGIVILIFGCAELTMGFVLADASTLTSASIYIPFWQGIMFLACGNLSIYTEMHPSKKMVTVCLAMYVVSILGVVVSIGYGMYCFGHIIYLKYRWRGDEWRLNRANQLLGIEVVLLVSSLCVSVILIVLSCVSRLALKSTHTQVILQCVPAPAQSDTTTN